MGLFESIAKVVSAPIKVCSLPARVFEKTFDMPREETVFDAAADAVREIGTEMDG